MTKFISKDKMSKKKKKALAREKRKVWEISPVTRTAVSKKIYSRKKRTGQKDDYPNDGAFSFDRYSSIAV